MFIDYVIYIPLHIEFRMSRIWRFSANVLLREYPVPPAGAALCVRAYRVIGAPNTCSTGFLVALATGLGKRRCTAYRHSFSGTQRFRNKWASPHYLKPILTLAIGKVRVVRSIYKSTHQRASLVEHDTLMAMYVHVAQ